MAAPLPSAHGGAENWKSSFLPNLACFGALIAAGCAEGRQEPPPPAFTVFDSAGVRVVVNARPQWGEGEGWRVSAQPLATLGVRDLPLEQQFHSLGEAIRLSDGTIVVLDLGDRELRAFNLGGDLLWRAGGAGDGPGEMRNYPDTRPVLTKLAGDTLQVQNGLDRIRYGSSGEVLEHQKVNFARLRELGDYALYYCPFDTYFLHDEIVVCHTEDPSPPPDSWTSRPTVMRTDWDLDAVDTLGVFLAWHYWLERSSGGIAFRSPLGPQGLFHIGGGRAPKLLHARNDAYRIEVWDLVTGSLAMVVERQVPRRSRTDEEVEYLAQTGDIGLMRDYIDIDVNPENPHWAAIDSVSIAESLFLDELGFIWVRRGPSPLDGEYARLREVTGPDEMQHSIPAPSGLHEIFRRDGVYLGEVRLPDDLRITEIGPDYVLGVVRDEWDIQYVRLYGLDRGSR